jgi:hypothetical protein
VDALSVEDHDQKQMLLVQTARGRRRCPISWERSKGQRVGRVVVREPTLEDAYVRLVGGKCMNVRGSDQILAHHPGVAEMTLRQQMTDGFILFTVLFQPIIIAVLGLWMLKDKGADAAMFVVVGSGLTGLWSSLLFISGGSINSNAGPGRWSRWWPFPRHLK